MLINTYRDLSGQALKQVYIPHLNKFTKTMMAGDEFRAISPVWKDIRSRRLAIDNYKCVQCGSGINVEIHHIRYPMAWGMEQLEDLRTLCDKCHRNVHKDDLKK